MGDKRPEAYSDTRDKAMLSGWRQEDMPSFLAF